MRTIGFLALGLIAAGCDGGQDESCDFEATCPLSESASETIEVRCEVGNKATTCSCLRNGAEFATCESDEVCPTARFGIDEGLDRNDGNAAFVPMMNDCCGTEYGPKQFDYDTWDVVEDGCDVLSFGHSPATD